MQTTQRMGPDRLELRLNVIEIELSQWAAHLTEQTS